MFVPVTKSVVYVAGVGNVLYLIYKSLVSYLFVFFSELVFIIHYLIT